MAKLINAEVNIPINISKLVTKYISTQTTSQQPPFNFMLSKKSQLKGKKSLQDWRRLFKAPDNNNTNRLFSSDRKFYRSENFQDKRFSSRTQAVNRKTAKLQNRTSTSIRQTFLDSALVQNYYEQQYINERKIQTAQIRKHYEKNSQKRPIMTSQNKKRLSFNQDNLVKQFRLKTPNNKKIKAQISMQEEVWPQKYDNVKIQRKHIRKCNDIIIEGLKQFKNDKVAGGFRKYSYF